MACTHALASGMGGMRTAGDLVARAQMAYNMKIREAKEYVADRLKISVVDLSDPVVMKEVREDLGIGWITQIHNRPMGIGAKIRIAEVLGIEINSVNKFRQETSF